MIIKEKIKINDQDFIYLKSDKNVYIKKIKLGGFEELYAETVFPIEFEELYRYEETDIEIESDEYRPYTID